jgi:ribosomal protein S18 acetylase RimI-like enzyme
VINWARQHHVSAVRLGVKADNAPAIALYRRNDFVDVGPDLDRSDERLMRRASGS